MLKRWLKIDFMIALFLLAGCAHELASKPINPETGHFSSFSTGCPEIVINRQVNTAKYDSIVYVKADLHGHFNPNQYRDLLMQSFEQMGFFQQVQTHEPITYINMAPALPHMVRNKPWYDVVDPLSMETLKRRYGDFLVAECTLWEAPPESNGFKRVTFTVRLIDPRDGATLLYVKQSGVDWTGVNQNLIFPVLNAVNDWLQASRHSVVRRG